MLKSKQGFTLIELLVVIGILAVLAAIAIPAVAGLIDRANVAHDNTNANEMTNSIERFASEYELYRNDVSSIGVTVGEMDTMQGRVYNVVGATTRNELGALEGVNYDKDTLYPLTRTDARKVISGYMKTTSKTFDPKQSDKCYWYCPSAGIVVVGDSDAVATELNALVVSGKDAKGNDLTPATEWIDLTCGEDVGGENNNQPVIPDDESEISWFYLFGGNPAMHIDGSNYNEMNILVAYAGGTHDPSKPATERYLFKYETIGASLYTPSADQMEQYNNRTVNDDAQNGEGQIWRAYLTSGGAVYGYNWSEPNEVTNPTQTYDQSTDTLTATFSNGVVLELRSVSGGLDNNPYIKINGQWYQWNDRVKIGQSEYLTQDLIAVSDSDKESAAEKINITYAVLVDGAPAGATGNIMYGMMNINNESGSPVVQLQMFDTSKYDYNALSAEDKAIIDSIGLENVCLNTAFNYNPADGKTYVLNPTTLTAPSVPTEVSSNYNETTDTMIKGYDNFSLKITNFSTPTTASFEVSFDGGNTWLSVYSMLAI